jgi:phospholipase C
MNKVMRAVAVCAALAVTSAPVAIGTASANGSARAVAPAAKKPATLPGGYKHLVVIYEENHSFDNLYGGWGSVNGQHVEGLSDATPAASTQVDQYGVPYTCLLQDDVNLTSPDPLSTTCHDTHHVNASNATTASEGFDSHFTNQPFSIDSYIHPSDNTCPDPATFGPAGGVKKDAPGSKPGGCTRDIVHRFYQEKYQIDGGKQDRYVTGSDAVGLTMGNYDTTKLPVYTYLHSKGAPKYVLADHFFQAANGGSFLNHQWLIAARSPLDTGGATPKAANSVLDSNGMPTTYPLYTPNPSTPAPKDLQLTVKCADPTVMDYPAACGDFAVNTVQPSSPPSGGGAKIPLIQDDTYPNIGDRMSAAGISWNWYAGGWDKALHDAANASTPGYTKQAPLFQYHHQPFNYFAAYAPGQPGRAHLQDENNFLSAVQDGTLPTVSFVKPYGAENEHPGYASESTGSDHLVKLLKAVTDGPQAGNTLVVVTYDEFGGQWDHVPPPGTGGTPGVHDNWGPGTRIPALVIGRSLKHSGVDHTSYDTTSILATIEHSYGLAALSTRDATVNDLTNAVAAGGR